VAQRGEQRAIPCERARLDRRLAEPYFTMRDSVSNRRKLLYVATALI